MVVDGDSDTRLVQKEYGNSGGLVLIALDLVNEP